MMYFHAILFYISMVLCKTAISPLLTHWRYCSLALSHRYWISAGCSNLPSRMTITLLTDIEDHDIFYAMDRKGCHRIIKCGLFHSLTWCSDIQNVKTAKGLALQDILSEVHKYVHRSKYMFPDMSWHGMIHIGTIQWSNVCLWCKFNSLRLSDIYLHQWTNQHWFRQWLVAWPAPSHHLKQC